MKPGRFTASSAISGAATSEACPDPGDGRYTLELPLGTVPEQLLAELVAAGAHLVSLNPIRQTLEDFFVQQVTAASITNSPSSGEGASSGSSSKGGSSSAAAPAPQTYSRTLARTGAAMTQVNGKVQTVRIGASFPSSNPLFTLVSVAHGVARIGIANGSYASGAQTVTLAAGRSLTLVDTADGIRYKVQLVSAS